MFTSKTPWIILLIAWMAGSTWWHVCHIKQLCADSTPTIDISNSATTDLPTDTTAMSVAADSVATSIEPVPAAPTPVDTPTIKSGKTTEETLANAEKYKSVFEPIDLYFRSGQAIYIKTPETEKFFDEAQKYLAEHKDKKLLLTGYTDDTGPERVNVELSRDRANLTKQQLRKAGVVSAQIRVEAKGESDPKASNATEEGRKANRRVTVVVQ